jgi:uncharacterized membrane protein
MSELLVLVLAFLIGVVCGLRSLTGPALVSWGAHLGWLSLAGSHFSFFANPLVVAIFSLLAVGELVADKLPGIPRRTKAGPLAARVVLGGICGGALAVAGGASFGMSCFLGAVGGLIGAYAGYTARRVATHDSKLLNLAVALFEDLVAAGGGLLLVSRF